MQLHGQIVATDIEYDDDTRAVVPGTGRVGIVKSTGTASLHQPDRVTRDAVSHAEVSREPRPDIEVQTVTVVWEDGSESTLTEHLDAWVVLGSVEAFPDVKDAANPTPGAYGELPEQQAVTDEHVGRVAEVGVALRGAAPLAAQRAEAEREVVIEDDGGLTLAGEQ